MDWIKRNLYFVIGASVALVLMVSAGFYTWSGWSNNGQALEELNGKYEELKGLINRTPNPGGGAVDNIKTARAQQQQAVEVITKVATRFAPIPPIPALKEGETNVTAEAFAYGLATAIYRLQNGATNAGVILPPRYNFSFEQQSRALNFAPGSVGPLAVQLGEINAIAEVLIAAKINSLESIQRERVSSDDMAGPATDYVNLHSETNDLAILSPYQITFRSFTPELTQVLCGFASSSNGIIVKSINVEPSAMTYSVDTPMVASPIYVPPVQPNPAYPIARGRAGEESAAFRERYGIGPGARTPPPVAPQPFYAPTGVTPAPTAPRTVLDEKQLKITMLVQVVKLQPKK
jgi:hypothetical protein